MTKNEIGLIEDWLNYHVFLFGAENIYILDGSTDQRILNLYKSYEEIGVSIFSSRSHLDRLAEELTDLMHVHKGEDNFLIKMDTDEFLAFTAPTDLRAMSPSKQEFRTHFINKYDRNGHLAFESFRDQLFDLSFRFKRVFAARAQKFLSELPVTGQRYKASLTMWSVPRAETSNRPCLDVVKFTSPQFTHLKSFFHSESFISVDLGGHVGVSSKNEGVIDTGLTIIHYHSTSVEDTIRRARQVLISHDYLSQEDSDEEALQKLGALEGRRMSSSHKVRLYLEYLRTKANGGALSPHSLNSKHPYFRKARPRKMTLVRDVLMALGS